MLLILVHSLSSEELLHLWLVFVHNLASEEQLHLWLVFVHNLASEEQLHLWLFSTRPHYRPRNYRDHCCDTPTSGYNLCA